MKKSFIVLLVSVILSGCGTVAQTITAQPPTDVPPTVAPTAEPCHVEYLQFTPITASVDSFGNVNFVTGSGGNPHIVSSAHVIDQKNIYDLSQAAVTVDMTLSGDCGFEPQGADPNHFLPFEIFNPYANSSDTSARAEVNHDVFFNGKEAYQTRIYLGGQLDKLECRLQNPEKTVLFTIDLIGNNQ